MSAATSFGRPLMSARRHRARSCDLPWFYRGHGRQDYCREQDRPERGGFYDHASGSRHGDAARDPAMTPWAGPMRILVVDDEPAILRFLRASLESQGYTVSTAADARTALDLVRRHTADLVVLDLGLPDMDGLDVVRQIRDGGETLPIIILSSRDNESAKVEALDRGSDDYVTKPFGNRRVIGAHPHGAAPSPAAGG